MNNKILIYIALVLSIIALLNPHIEYKKVSKEEIIKIEGYSEFSTNEKYSKIANMDPFSAKFECSDNVVVTNNFGEMCSVVNKNHYCLTDPMWELGGQGVCQVNYKEKTWFLRWF